MLPYPVNAHTAVARTLIGGGGCLFIYSCSARLVSFEIKFKFINLKRNYPINVLATALNAQQNMTTLFQTTPLPPPSL